MSEQFARVPIWILGRSDVSWAAKILYGLIARYVGSKGREAWPSIELLRSDMRTSRRNVERWLEELKEAGLVDVERTGRASTYRLLGSEPDEAPEGATLAAPPAADQMRQESRIRSAEDDVSDPPEMADQIRQNPRIVASPTFISEEIKEEIIQESVTPLGASGPIGEAEQLMKRARGALLRGYQARYEKATGETWMGHGRASSDIDTCARVAIARGADRIDERVAAMLEHVFADDWMTKNRWPWAAMAKDPARYLAAPTTANSKNAYVKVEPKPGEYDHVELHDGDIPEEFMKKGRVIGYGG